MQDNDAAAKAAQMGYADLKSKFDNLVRVHNATLAENATLQRQQVLVEQLTQGGDSDAFHAAIHERDRHKQDALDLKGQLAKHVKILTDARDASGCTALESLDLIVREMRIELMLLRKAVPVLRELKENAAAEDLVKAHDAFRAQSFL